MLLRILNKEKQAVAGIDKHRELCITYSLDFSDKVLSFEAETADIKGVIVPEGYIETPEDRFVIKEIEENADGTANVIAQLDLEALEGKAIRSFETVEQTIKQALQLAFAGTGWLVNESTVTKKRTLRMTHVSALDVLKQALKTYRCEIIIDSKNQAINIYPAIGENKGVYFKDNLNLTDLNVKRSSYDFYTEIEPIGKDGVTIEEVNNGLSYLTNYTYSTKRKRLIWKDERYTVLANLKEDAAAKLNDYAKPYVSYAGKVLDLARESNRYAVLDYNIGDTVYLLDSVTFTKEEQRIVALKEYPEEWWRNELTYANKVLSFDEMVQKYDETASTVDNITSDNGTVKGSSVDSIETAQIVGLDNAIMNNATIQNLSAEYVNVSGRLNAVSASIGELEANVAYIDNLNAVYATIEQLDAKSATITDLNAVNASIGTLEADYANITNLLAGNAGIGQLQNIHLTSANTVIDQGLVNTLLANIAVINDLIAGTISTSDINIGSNDGGLAIRGNLIQFKDQNGVVRIQIGKDAQDNFTFVLYDETGQGQLLNAEGITASAISDGLIVNDMVASNAGISAEKLDIASLFRVLNDNGTETLKANRIFFDDENQTLHQVYTQMSSNISTLDGQISGISNIAETAQNAAISAVTTAENALLALKGITTVDALAAQLTNDAHVVHTDYDGTGGDFSYAKTRIWVFMGDDDITALVDVQPQPSEGVTGTWNPTTKEYQVTGMTGLNGYVDFDVAYGEGYSYLFTPDDKRLVMPNNDVLTIKSDVVHIHKRFSISKSPDGQAGASYNLMASVDAIRRKTDGTLNPSSITFTANYCKGGDVIAYSGRFKIELSYDGVNYEQVYNSISNELARTYIPPSNAFSIKCTLYDQNYTLLDTQSVIVIADADELVDVVDGVVESVSTVNTRVTEISTGVEGLQMRLGDIQTQIYGLSDGELLVNVSTSYTSTGRIYTAHVYRKLEDIKEQFDAGCFQWYMETAEGETYLGYGYSITVNNSQIDRDGCIRLDFVSTGEAYLQTPNGKNILTPDNKYLTIITEDTGQFRDPSTYDDIPSLSGGASPNMLMATPKTMSLGGTKLNTTGFPSAANPDVIDITLTAPTSGAEGLYIDDDTNTLNDTENADTGENDISIDEPVTIIKPGKLSLKANALNTGDIIDIPAPDEESTNGDYTGGEDEGYTADEAEEIDAIITELVNEVIESVKAELETTDFTEFDVKNNENKGEEVNTDEVIN